MKQPDALTLRLREIAGSATSPEDALEPMVQAVIESTGACAGAICLYDVRQRQLRLAIESGLSDEGCRRLRIVRKGEPDAWEMPLHGLMNGRAYLIDNASQNRFVPPLIEEASEMTTVVCLPLYSGQTPLASLILVAHKPRRFDERELHAVEEPLREMARAIEATRRHAEGRSAAAPPPRPPVPAPAGAAPTADAGEVARLRAALARVEQERDRLAAAAQSAPPPDGARVAELRGEIDRLQSRLGEAEATAARERGTREELASRFEGGATAGRQEIQRAQSAVREAETARGAALAEVARLRAELERAHLESAPAPTEATALDARVVELLAEVDGLRANLAEAEAGAAHAQRAREEIEGRLAGGLNAGQQELRKALATARDAERGRMAALAEAARLRSELEIVRIEAAPGAGEPGTRDDRIGPLLAEIDRLRARLAEAEAGAAHEHRARDELETRLAQGITTGQQELRHALDAARAAEEARATNVAEMGQLRAELDRVRSESARAPGTREEIDARVVELATEIDRLRTRVAEAEAGAAHQHRAREELEARLTGGVTSGQQDLRKALETARRAEQEKAAAVAEAARLGAELERARLAATQTPEQAAQATARWTELTTEIDRLHTRLAEAEAGAAHEHRAREALEARLAETAEQAQRDRHEALASARVAANGRGDADAELARLAAELRETQGERARLAELQRASDAQAAELAAEVARLASRADDAEARAADERRARDEVEARVAAERATENAAREAALADVRASADATVQAELARAAAELDAARVAAARADALATALAEAEAHRVDLAAQLDAATAAREEQQRVAAERDAAAVAAHANEIEALRARLADAEAAATREQRARAALETAASHDLDRREEDLRAALESARVAEEHRDKALAEVMALRHERDTVRGGAENLERESAEQRVELARLARELQDAAGARDERTRLLDAAARREEAVGERLAELERDLARERDARAELEASLADADRTAGSERDAHAAAAAERDRLAAGLAEASAARARSEQALDAALGDARAEKQAHADACTRIEELTGRLTASEAALGAEREARSSDEEALGARIEALIAESDRLRDAHATIATVRDRMAADLEGATAAKAHLEHALQDALAAGRTREQAAMDEAQRAAAALAERETALQALGDRLAAEIATRDERLTALHAELDGAQDAHAALAAERDRLAADLQGAAAGTAHLQDVLDRTLEASRAHDDDLRDARGCLWETAAHLEETTRSLRASSDASAQEIATLSRRVGALTTAAHDLRDAHAGAVAERDRLAADLQGATAARDHLEEALEHALAESRTRDQEADTYLETARAQLWSTAARLAEIEQRVAAAGEERAEEVAAFTERVESLEADADRLREAEATIGGERDRLAASLEGTVAAKTHLEEALKQALESARARDQEAAVLLQDTRSQAWATAARLADTEVTLRTLAEERATEVGALTARAEALRADTERLREHEAAVTSERDHLAAELAGARAEHERLEQTFAETRARAEQAATELAARMRDLEALQATHATIVAERDAAVNAAAAAPAEPSTAAPPARPAATLPPARSAPATPGASRPTSAAAARPTGPSAAPSKPATPESPRIALLDVDGAWADAAAGDANLVVVVPTDEAVRALAKDWPGRVLVNLAAPGAMRALLTIRELHAPIPILGCLANGDRVLPLGPIEPAGLPLAPDAIVAAIAKLAPARARVVTVGADVDALLSLRQALARQGTSVSLAWDGKQATELVDMVHPHAVVADLGAPYDAGAVLARLATSSPVPAAVLIDATADAAGALAMVLNNPDVAEKVVSRTDLLRKLAARAGAKSPPAATLRPAAGSVAGR